MNESPSQELPIWVVILIPIAFCIVFPIFWCFVMWINSHVGGWSRLAKHYRTDDEPSGKTWNGVYGSVGIVSYRGVLQCVANEDGIYLRPGAIFRFAHPLLFIPWSEFHDVKRRDFLWLPRVVAKVGKPKVGSLSLDAKVFEGAPGKALLS